MIKFFLFLYVFIISINLTYANYPYFYFDESKVKIRNGNFYRYIIPQSQAIVKEYYHILRKLNPLHAEIVHLKKQVDKLHHSYSSRKPNCYKIPGLCKKELSNLFTTAIKIDSILSDLKIKHNRLSKKSYKDYTDDLLITSQKINQLSGHTYKLIHMIEEELLSLNTRYEIHSSSKKNMNQLILRIMSHTHMIITAFVPPMFKQEFDFVWENYITKLEKYIIRDKNKKYLIRHLGELNISWNSFHMKLAKGNLNFPKKLLKIISIQHNRWNTILKVILRR